MQQLSYGPFQFRPFVRDDIPSFTEAVHGFCNLGYWVRESWQRKGAAFAAIQALTHYGFSKLELGRIEIVVAAGNSPSLSLAAKSGAIRECLARNRLKIHGRFTDAYVFSLTPPSGV